MTETMTVRSASPGDQAFAYIKEKYSNYDVR